MIGLNERHLLFWSVLMRRDPDSLQVVCICAVTGYWNNVF